MTGGRRASSLVALAIVFALLLAACAPSFGRPTPEPKGGGGEFRVVLTGEPTSLNPDLRVDDPAFYISQNIYNKLVTLDTDWRVIPDLADKWDISADGLTYKFYLNKDARWHDGQPVTAADVKWTFETIKSGNGFAKDVMDQIANIETPNKTTVVVKLKEVWSPFLSSLAWYGTFILPRHVYEGADWAKHPANEKPVGSGPFVFSQWAKGEQIVLEANRAYFRRGPYLDRVVYRILKDPSTGVDLLLRNEADYTLARPAAERMPQLQQTAGIKVSTSPNPGRYYVGFNLRHSPLDDVRVRSAINMAIHREALVERALLGYGSPAYGLYTPAVAWAYNTTSRVPAFDPAGAEKLLDEAGLPRGADGLRFRVQLTTVTNSPYKEMASFLHEALTTVGIGVTVTLLSTTEYTRRVNEQMDFDLAITNGSWGPDPDNLRLRFGSARAAPPGGYASPEFSAAVTEGATKVKLDQRAQAYFRAQDILARDLPFAPLAETVIFTITRDNVSGLAYSEARGLVTFQNYSLVRLR